MYLLLREESRPQYVIFGFALEPVAMLRSLIYPKNVLCYSDFVLNNISGKKKNKPKNI